MVKPSLNSVEKDQVLCIALCLSSLWSPISCVCSSWLLQFHRFSHSGMEKKFEKSIFFSSVVFFQSQAGNAAVLEHRSPEPAASPLQKEPLQQIRYVCVWPGHSLCAPCLVRWLFLSAHLFWWLSSSLGGILHFFPVHSEPSASLEKFVRNTGKALKSKTWY